jgi:hypothetical protein
MLLSTKRGQKINRVSFLFIYIILFALVQIPVWLVEYLPIQDYPNHLARMHIILNIHNNEYLQKYYDIAFKILPNLAMDIIVPNIANIFPLEVAGRLMLVVVLFTMTSGSIFLNYVLFRKVTIFSFIPFIFMFNEAFIKGFINFLFGVGLAMWCIGLWVMLRQSKLWLRIGLFSILSSLIFISHLFAFGFYTVTIVSYELGLVLKKRSFSYKEILFNSLQFTPPMFLYYFSPTSEGKTLIEYSSLKTKFFEFPYYVFSPYVSQIKTLGMAGLILILVIALYRNKIKINNLMLLPISALSIIYLVIPKTLSSGANVDWRILIPLFLVFASSIDIDFSNENNQIIKFVLPIILIVIFSLNLSSTAWQWMSLQNEYKGIILAIENIEEGSRLFSGRQYNYLNYKQMTVPFMHAPTYAIIKKSAFVPMLFAIPTQQPVSFKDNYKNIVKATGSSAYDWDEKVDWDTVIKSYDYVLLSQKQLLKDIPQTSLTKVFERDYSILYKVNHVQ